VLSVVGGWLALRPGEWGVYLRVLSVCAPSYKGVYKFLLPSHTDRYRSC